MADRLGDPQLTTRRGWIQMNCGAEYRAASLVFNSPLRARTAIRSDPGGGLVTTVQRAHPSAILGNPSRSWPSGRTTDEGVWRLFSCDV